MLKHQPLSSFLVPPHSNSLSPGLSPSSERDVGHPILMIVDFTIWAGIQVGGRDETRGEIHILGASAGV